MRLVTVAPAIKAGRSPGPRPSLAIPRRSTAPRRPRVDGIPWGHVNIEQLKREAEAGIEYFWRRRPAALRPPSGSFLDFSKSSTA